MDLTTFVLYNQPKDRDAPILIDAEIPERTLSWYDYASAVKRIAVGLQARRVVSRDCVGLLSYNDIYYHVLAHGVIAAGAAFAPIPTDYTAADISRTIVVAKMKVLFASGEFLRMAEHAAQTLPNRKRPVRIILFDPPGVRKLHYHEEYDSLSSLIDKADARFFANLNAGTDLARQTAYRMFTGCWANASRAAEISHTTHLRRLMSAMRPPWSTGDPPRCSLQSTPMYHATAALASELALLGEWTVYVAKCTDDDGAKIIELIRKLNITDVQLSRPDLSAVVKDMADSRRKDQLWSLRRAVISGPAREEVLSAFHGLLGDEASVVVLFGNPECWNFSMLEFDSNWVNGSIGRPCPGVQVQVVSREKNEPLIDGDVGEICVRSDKVMTEYYRDPDATAARFLQATADKRWFRTGCHGWIEPATQLIYLEDE